MAHGAQAAWRRAAVVVTVVGMLGGACGREGEAPEEEGATAAPTTTAPETGPAAGDFGDLGAVCGPAPAGTDLAATDTGVTATSIEVGTIADPGFSGRPGINQEVFDAAEAFSKWCNDAGGIFGRRLEVRARDAKLTEHQSRIIEACDEGDFMLVGSLGIFDDQGQEERLACELPHIGLGTNPPAAGADLLLKPIPNTLDWASLGDLRWLEEQFPEATQKIGFLTGGVAVTMTAADRAKEAMEILGWDVVYDELFNAAGEASWRGFVEGMKDAGVRGVVWTADPAALAALLKEMAELEFHPDFVRAATNIYDPLLLAEAGRAADNVFIASSSYPFLDPELAEQNPPTQQFLDIMEEYAPSGKIADLGLMSFSSWLLFAQAAAACGAELTRDCVWERATSVTKWSGGGLHAEQNLAENRASQCFVEIEADRGRWVMPDIDPNVGLFRCDPDFIVPLEGDYGTGARCTNPAFADDPRPSNCAA